MVGHPRSASASEAELHRTQPSISRSQTPFLGRRPSEVAYQTKRGRMYQGLSDVILERPEFRSGRLTFQLVFTSPPFPLNRKKRYGNLDGSEYVDWLADIGTSMCEVLSDNGSIVMEMGNSWQSGRPTMSNLALEALLEFQRRNDLYLCQEFIWNNPAKLPTPAQWVNVERIRLKDSHTRLWWMSRSMKPEADNRRVLQPYSAAMEKLLRRGKYNAGSRPSEHKIGKRSFLKNHGGSIPGSVITIANTANSDGYIEYCRTRGVRPHPARMPIDLAEFFIRFLTKEGDLVLDPFSGSNTTGCAAERLGRFWVSIDSDPDYVAGSMGRFPSLVTPDVAMRNESD